MAEPITTSLATEAVKAVTARAVEEIRLYSGFKDQLEKLKNRLLYIQALLEDLGSKHNEEQSSLVNVWLEEIEDAAFSAENVMDDYAYEMLRRKIELKINNKPSFKKKCRKFITPSTNPIFFRCRMSHRVSEILSMFDELGKKAEKLGLKPADLAAKNERPSTYYGDDYHHKEFTYDVGKGSNIIGRKLDEDELLLKLLNVIGNEGNHGLPTIAITGFGGLGKTTLARWLYEHKEVDKHFDKKKIWICVSGNINVHRILEEMVNSISLAECKLPNTDAIIKSLQKELKANKFLLVLDDVWDENQRSWESLKNALQSIGAPLGSVVLMTTRNIEIPKKAGAFYSHPVQGLSEADAWDLLKHEIFDETTFPYDSSFDDIGRRIVNKCKGVPLSIIVISGLLRSKGHPSEWEPIERSHLWDFQQEDILPSLLLSYNHLGSASVKQCFAYCAIFPQDSLMQKRQLIFFWLSQDLLHHRDSEIRGPRLTMEEIGEKYFNILVNHSLLQEEREDGERIGYKMHDLVHDLASYISRKDVLVLKGGDKLEEVASNHRHLVFNFDNNETDVEIPSTEMMKKLRTICFWDTTVCRWNSLKSAQYMRTLIMDSMWLSEVPPIVGQLIHLRYLDLSHNYELTALPESICNLYQLQTLRLLLCYELRELPSELHRLENLRHIETTDHLQASSGLRKLTNLQTLPSLQLRASSGWTIDELGPLDQVKGDIHIIGLEHVKNREDAKKAGIGRKEGVLGLYLSWYSAIEESSDEDVLDSLEPHSNIKSLCLDGFNGKRLPPWVMTMVVNHGGNNPTRLANLVELKLIDCKRCQQLPCLGQLPVLRILWLERLDNVECIGDEFYGISRSNNNINAAEFHLPVTGKDKVLFPALKKLHILSFAKLTTWVPPSLQLAAFPSLEILEIRNCQQLQELLNCTHNLMKLELIDCTGFKQLPTLGHLAGIAFPSLEILTIECCPCLETVPASHIQSLKSLTLEKVNGSNQPLDIIKYSHGLISLKVKQLEKMVTLPPELSNCGNLQELEVWECLSLACIPDGAFHGLSSLRDLIIDNCKGLERMPTSLKECTSLKTLSIIDCPLIKGSIPDLSRLYNLERLSLARSGEWSTSWQNGWIPQLRRLRVLCISWFGDEWDFNSTSLLHLQIEEFDKLEGLPECIGNLSSLEQLCLIECKNLKNLPSKKAMQRLSRLRELYIVGCPLLKERCAQEDEWINISYIPSIWIE